MPARSALSCRKSFPAIPHISWSLSQTSLQSRTSNSGSVHYNGYNSNDLQARRASLVSLRGRDLVDQKSIPEFDSHPDVSSLSQRVAFRSAMRAPAEIL